MTYTDDPERDFLARDRAMKRWLDRRPQCSVCREPIQDDHYYLLDRASVCPECLENYYREEIEEE